LRLKAKIVPTGQK